MIRSFFLIVVVFFSGALFSQKKVLKKFETKATEINIYTTGLDNVVLENSNTNFVEVYLYAQNYDEQVIKIEPKQKYINIKFDFEGAETREVIFRKYITKRLQRATAIIKIPNHKKTIIFGENVDIESESYNNNLAIYIENGIVKLHTIKAQTLLKLYAGNVYAQSQKNTLDITSKNGKIKIDSTHYNTNYKNTALNEKAKLTIISQKANIYLTTQ
ncbi:hypothetical protein [Polaribacter sp.]|uniref:hypothetical protein n=1 Tax=Polaribacter sp. TaxID=1920175 RepID=UPI003F6BF93C